MVLSLLGLGTGSPGYVFVVGCGHSGTSLATAMLGAHPRIYAIPFETNAFLSKQTDQEARSIIEAAAGERDKPVRLICEKTPRHIHHVARMAEIFPGARFVVCLRDPRDVASSIKRRTGKLMAGIERWRKDNEAAAAVLARPDCFALRYEALIAEPEPTLKRLCGFLGLSYRRHMMEFWRDDRDWFGAMERRDTDGAEGRNHVIRRNWQLHQPLMKDRIGVWRRELDAQELAEIVDRLASLARELEYELTDGAGAISPHSMTAK